MDWSGCDAVDSRAAPLRGAFVFTGTRIPVATLFDNLKAGATIDEFLDWFPGAKKNQIEAILSFVAGEKPQAA